MADADSVSRATYEDTKRLADERGSELAAAKASLEVYQQRGRTQLKALSQAFEPEVKSCYDESLPEDKSDLNQMLDWTRGCHERPNVEQQMPLAKLVHSMASKLKRSKDDASVTVATAEQLAAALKENESLKYENTNQKQRIGELDTSLKEITTNSAKLQEQLEKSGALQEKFDFSKTSSREADGKDDRMATNAADATSMVVKTENASKQSMQPMDAGAALFAFITTQATGSNARFMPTISNHTLLGAGASSDGHRAF